MTGGAVLTVGFLSGLNRWSVLRERGSRGQKESRQRATHTTAGVLPIGLAQLSLEDLVGPALGQLAGNKFYAARRLVAGDAAAAMLDQIARGERGAVLQHHARQDQLAPRGIGNSDDGGL